MHEGLCTASSDVQPHAGVCHRADRGHQLYVLPTSDALSAALWAATRRLHSALGFRLAAARGLPMRCVMCSSCALMGAETCARGVSIEPAIIQHARTVPPYSSAYALARKTTP